MDDGQRTTDNGRWMTDDGRLVTDDRRRTTDDGQWMTDEFLKYLSTCTLILGLCQDNGVYRKLKSNTIFTHITFTQFFTYNIKLTYNIVQTLFILIAFHLPLTCLILFIFLHSPPTYTLKHLVNPGIE
jgi:hypothetical protein